MVPSCFRVLGVATALSATLGVGFYALHAAHADSAPVIAVPGHLGVPVIINGIDATGAASLFSYVRRRLRSWGSADQGNASRIPRDAPARPSRGINGLSPILVGWFKSHASGRRGARGDRGAAGSRRTPSPPLSSQGPAGDVAALAPQRLARQKLSAHQ
jgi:hypothetical protein